MVIFNEAEAHFRRREMNLIEGLRRLGLAAGILGTIFGLVVAITVFTSLKDESEQQQKFRSLASSDAVLKAFNLLRQQVQAESGQKSSSPKAYSMLAALCGGASGWEINEGGVRQIYFDGSICTGIGTPSGVQTEEISVEEIEKRLAQSISTIETGSGTLLYRPSPPNKGQYFAALSAPIVGFLLPWGIVRLVAWIVEGFATPRPK
jgi:hypothetical protein